MTASFLGRWLRRSESRPADPAITLFQDGADVHFTHGELLAGARGWAGYLRSTGAESGDIVLIALPLGGDLFHSFLGALLAGCVPSFMPSPTSKQDPDLFWASHNALFARMGGGFIVTSAQNAEAIASRITDAVMNVVTPDEAALRHPDKSFTPFPWRSDQVACLQHSSGTTDLKKGVMLSFDKIEAQILAYRDTLGMTEDTVLVSWLPLYHDMGFIACFLSPLFFGGRVILLDPLKWVADPISLFRAVEAYRGEFIWLPNFAFHHLANAVDAVDRPADLSSLRAVIDCSEPCRAGSIATFEACFAPWGLAPRVSRTCYAMAETVFAATQSPANAPLLEVQADKRDLERGRVEISERDEETETLVGSGIPLPGVEIEIWDEALKPSPKDRIGQIVIRAPFLFDGYYLQPERTARSFHEGFYLTGDLGFVIGEELFVLGRMDDVLILSGRSLFAREIEDVAGGAPGVRPGRVCALGVYNPEIGTTDLVVILEAESEDADPSSIRKSIRSRLAAALNIIPKKIVLAPAGWVVKSTSGKINRRENRRKLEKSWPTSGGDRESGTAKDMGWRHE